MMQSARVAFSALSRRKCSTSLFYLGLVVLILLLIHIFIRLFAFVHLFGILGPHPGVRISQTKVQDSYNASTADSSTTVVPNILHQIFHHWDDPGNATLPPHWAAARQACISFNPEWDVKVSLALYDSYVHTDATKLWNLASSRSFIEQEYDWFLPTYDGYKFPIQRIDVLKYFLLHHYGGIYIDLDNVRCPTRFFSKR